MWWLLVAGLGWADETRVTYDLFVGRDDVGDRELVIRYLPREDGERRVLSVVTRANTPLGEVSCRQSAQSSARGANFTTSMQIAGVVSQVQGIQMPGGGWQLVVADEAGVHESELRPSEVRLTTLDLLDPGRTILLAQPGRIGILIAETGRILDGELRAGEPATVKIAGKSVAATKYIVEGSGGRAEVFLADDGLLLRSETDSFGGPLVVSLRALPEPRSFGSIELIEAPGAGVIEADL